MGKFITTGSSSKQLPEKGMFELMYNELYEDEDGKIYLAWRGFQTDHFTWLRKANWDIRCSHIHDIGCKYHQLVEVLLTEHQLTYKGYLIKTDNEVICKNIPAEYLKVVNISGHQINNMFYRMLKAADCPKTPKYIQWLYRAGVSFNVNWFRTGKQKIDLDKLYDKEWNKL